MIILIIVISFLVFLKTCSYGIYELTTDQNKLAGITIIILSGICLVIPPLIILFLK